MPDILHTNSELFGAVKEGGGDSYEERVKYFCRVKGTRMNMILTAIEHGRTNAQLVTLCKRWNKKHGRPTDVTSADEGIFDVYRKILSHELTTGFASAKANAEIEMKIQNKGTIYGTKAIGVQRAIRTATTLRRLLEGETPEQISSELRTNRQTIYNYMADYDTNAIGCVLIGKGFVPWNKWLLDSGFEELIK